MKNKKSPFEITNTMIDYVAEIAELVGKLTATSQFSSNPTLRRANRIRTIHGSLAIEQNTLICTGTGDGAAEVGQKQRRSYADPQLCVPL